MDKQRFRKAEATPTNQPQSTKPKLIDRPIILTGYENAPKWRLPNGRLRQRLPPVRYANEPQTLGLLSFVGFNPTYVGEISLLICSQFTNLLIPSS
jgi:hypothetical protein